MRGDNSNAIWLVKSGERVLGPYSTDEVAAGIKSKEIVIIDEVISPMSRWRLVRDEPRFKQAVEEIRRGQMGAREDTEVQGHTHTNTNTNTSSIIEALQGAQGSGVSALPADTPVAVSEPQSTNAAVSKNAAEYDENKVIDAEFTDEVVAPKNRPSSQSGDMRAYGVSSSATHAPRSTWLIKLAWFCAALAVVGGVYSVMNSPNRRTSNDPNIASKPMGFDNLVRAANGEWDRGHFSAALKLYRQANQARENRPEVVARLAPLMIQLDGETVAAKRMLTDTLTAMPPDTGASIKSQLEAGLGLAGIMSDDLNESEVHLRAADALVPGALAPLLNTGTIYYLRKSYPEAIRKYTIAGENPAALFLAARATLSSDRGSTALQAAENLFARMFARSQDFKQEALVIDAWLKFEGGNRKGALAQARAALDVDPDLTNDHWHDPLLYMDPFKWKSLVTTCRRIADELKFPTTRALLGLCLYKAGDREEGMQVISQGLAQEPENGLLQAVNAHLLFSSGRFEDARAALRLAFRAEKPKLAVLVGARICLQIGDVACAEKSFHELLLQETPTLAAMTGMVEILLRKTIVQGDHILEKPAKQQRADREAAAELLKRARSLSPNYRPALELLESVN